MANAGAKFCIKYHRFGKYGGGVGWVFLVFSMVFSDRLLYTVNPMHR